MKSENFTIKIYNPVGKTKKKKQKKTGLLVTTQSGYMLFLIRKPFFRSQFS